MSPNNIHPSRRKFLQDSLSLLAFAPLLQLSNGIINLKDVYRVGLIGCGWYGKSDLLKLMQIAKVEVAALCDVNHKVLEEAKEMIKQVSGVNIQPMMYRDYRTMLAKHKMDIVIIGTPDHWHALQAIDAMKTGANLYLQKPISVDVLEGEALLSAQQKYKSVVQVGLQRRSTPHILKLKEEVLDKGLLGKIKHVDMCCYYHMRDNRKLESIPPPSHLDWEMYCGPAPLRPYDSIAWRAYKEFGNGIVGDMCVHMYDTARWLLNLGWPKEVYSKGGIYVNTEANSNIPDTQTAVFKHDNLECVWTHRTWGTAPDPDYPWALFIYGEEGTLKISTTKAEFVPTDKKKSVVKYDVLYEREKYPSDLKEPRIELHVASATRRHFENLVQSIEVDKEPSASLLQSHISTASCILANMSMDLGRPLSYDPISKTVKGDKIATRGLKRAYRNPWQHPYK
jgi:predicted dehydrogenase